MINSKKELEFYLRADEIMNEQVFPHGVLKRLIAPSPIRSFLRMLRKAEYTKTKKDKNIYWRLRYAYYKYRYERLKLKTHFDIPLDVLGYGVRIGHLSTIVINGSASIGNYCCLQNNIVIADGEKKKIGDHVYIGSNTVVAKNITIASGCTLSSCSLVNKSCMHPDMLIGGVAAIELHKRARWTEEEPYKSEFLRCEALKKEMQLDNYGKETV